MCVVATDGHDITARSYFRKERVGMAQITAGANAEAVDKQLELASDSETNGVRNTVPPILPISTISARTARMTIGSRDAGFAYRAG